MLMHLVLQARSAPTTKILAVVQSLVRETRHRFQAQGHIRPSCSSSIASPPEGVEQNNTVKDVVNKAIGQDSHIFSGPTLVAWQEAGILQTILCRPQKRVTRSNRPF